MPTMREQRHPPRHHQPTTNLPQPQQPLHPPNRNDYRHQRKKKTVNLLDIIAATEAKQQALQQVAAATDPTWATNIENLILQLPTQTFTTDDIWQAATDANLPLPHEPRALGAILHRLARNHQIIATDTFTPSQRAACHRRPIRVWRHR